MQWSKIRQIFSWFSLLDGEWVFVFQTFKSDADLAWSARYSTMCLAKGKRRETNLRHFLVPHRV